MSDHADTIRPPIIPTPQPHRWQACPVCRGKGLVPRGFYDFGPTIPSTGTGQAEKCRSCGGRGVL